MIHRLSRRRPSGERRAVVGKLLPAAAVALLLAACAPAAVGRAGDTGPDPRVGLRAGRFDAGEARWNLRTVATAPPAAEFLDSKNTDLAFTGDYVIQGSFGGFQVWDISDRARPSLVTRYACPTYQGDVSVYRNLLVVSGEDLSSRLDCGATGVREPASPNRLRGLRIFDISDIRNPRYVGNVQTCRGSHTNTLVVDPADPANVYVYVSGSNPVRPAEELAGCSGRMLAQDPNTALFRIEVVKVPLADPARAAIVSSPRIFTGITYPASHQPAPADQAELDSARAQGGFFADLNGKVTRVSDDFMAPFLARIVRERGGTGAPTAADTARVIEQLPVLAAEVATMMGGPIACHDITAYPAIGLAAGACAGHGFLLDISDPANPRRVTAVSDSNFAFWHSATFNNEGTKVLFADEWGGGSLPKCRPTDPMAWGANAIFTLAERELKFEQYYKMPAPQTSLENCVAHNASLIPIPGRDVLVQAWYQGGVSVVDWTDSRKPVEIAFQDRGPVDSTRLADGGSWSAYWYNGVIVSSEIARGLDIFELVPSAFLTQNEIDAAKSVRLEYLNPQSPPRYVWPATFALARAYVDQLERSNELRRERVAAARQALTAAEGAEGEARRTALVALATRLEGGATGAAGAQKLQLLTAALRELASR